MNPDPDLILTSLSALIDLPLTRSTRAGTMRCFQFGKLVVAPTSVLPLLETKPRGLVGELAIHVQCPWRLDADKSIVTGLTDLWQPVLVSETFKYNDWDWDRDGNLQDQQMTDYFARHLDAKVVSVSLFDHGSFTLHLSGNVKLFVFVSGCASEDWRIIRHDSASQHLVVTGGMVESQTDEMA